MSTLAVKALLGDSACYESLSTFKPAQLPVSDYWAETYNGAKNTAGQKRGCTSCFQQLALKAPYIPCASHDLKLGLSKACSISDMQYMVDIMRTVGVLCNYSSTEDYVTTAMYWSF